MRACVRMGMTVMAAAFGPLGLAHAAQEGARQAAAALVRRMTLPEEAGQLASTAPAIRRLGIPPDQWWTEALHGVVSERETTDFPAPIGLAASFDTGLVHDVAAAISAEARAIHARDRAAGTVGPFGEGGALDVWAPNINIVRDPRWGRGQETYGEDPFLTARMGVAYVEGMQGPDPQHPWVIATPKHFAVYNGPEATRHTLDARVSLHDLEDTYLPAWRAVVVDAHAGSIMCSYNAVNGQPACANDFLLRTVLRGEWHFKGYVVSDCGAVQALQTAQKFVPSQASAVAAALKAGVDLECVHPNLLDAAKSYVDAVNEKLLTKADIDWAVTRLMAARIRVGDIGPDGHAVVARSAALNTLATEHRALALRSAEESLVLLKNDGVLPLRPGAHIVVTGPLADSVRVLRSDYSSPNVPAPVSVLAGMRRQFSAEMIRHVPAGPSYTDGDPVPLSALSTANGTPGMTAQYFQLKITDPAHPEMSLRRPVYERRPFKTAIVDQIGGDVDPGRSFYKAVYRGYLVPPATGTYRIGLKGMFAKLTFRGRVLADLAGYPPPQLGELATVRLEAGHRYPFRIEETKAFAMAGQFVWSRISEHPVVSLRAAARNADVIVAVVGLNADLESEQSGLVMPGFYHGDRTSLDLPPDQLGLLKAAKATGKKLIVVDMSGSAINLSWAQRNADAVLQVWYPGEEGGDAVARVLSGRVDPGGRLPVTFYKSVRQLPPFDDYSMANRTYRYFRGTPLYLFGYGLSYTRFAFSRLKLSTRTLTAGQTLDVSVDVTNVGARAGDEVAELYLAFPPFPGRPIRALRGFARVHLVQGETRRLLFSLDPRRLSSVTEGGDIEVQPGHYRLTVGGGQPGTGAPEAIADFRVRGRVVLPP